MERKSPEECREERFIELAIKIGELCWEHFEATNQYPQPSSRLIVTADNQGEVFTLKIYQPGLASAEIEHKRQK